MPDTIKYIETKEDLEAVYKSLPKLNYRPVVGATELMEVAKILGKCPKLEFPIASGGELIEKLGGPEATMEIDGIKMSPLRMIKYMPANYFPIFSMENFIEKMGELIRENRRKFDIPREIEHLRKQLPRFHYPIKSAKQLVELIGNKSIRFNGGEIIPSNIVDRIPDSIFPIPSEDDLYRKIRRLMASVPLVAGD